MAIKKSDEHKQINMDIKKINSNIKTSEFY